MDEVEKIVKEPIQSNRNTRDWDSHRSFQKGYRCLVKFGYEIDIGDHGIDRMKLNIINGFQTSPLVF